MRAGAPRPPGKDIFGPGAASIINARGAISEASSASPNCSSNPKMFRSIGSSQMFCLESKYPLTHAEWILVSIAAAYCVINPPSPHPIIPIGCLGHFFSNQSTNASDF